MGKQYLNTKSHNKKKAKLTPEIIFLIFFKGAVFAPLKGAEKLSNNVFLKTMNNWQTRI